MGRQQSWQPTRLRSHAMGRQFSNGRYLLESPHPPGPDSHRRAGGRSTVRELSARCVELAQDDVLNRTQSLDGLMGYRHRLTAGQQPCDERGERWHGEENEEKIRDRDIS